MTKQTRTLVGLAAALVVCGGAYGGLRLWNEQQEQVDDATYVLQLSQVTGVSFTNSYGTYSFTKTEDTWRWDEDEAFPADQDALEELAEQVGTLTAVRVIQDPEDLSAYGLDAPALQTSVTGGDGQSATLLLGTVADDYCYAKLEDSDTIYTIATDLPEQLQELELLDLAAIPEFPSLGTDNITSLTWESGETALTLTKTEAEESTGDTSADSSEEAEPTWDVNGAPIPADNSTFTSLMAQVSSLALDACYDYQGLEDTLSACGLDTPVGILAVTYGEGESLTLTLGALDGTGEAYYVQLSGDPAVYQMSADSVSTLVSLTADALTAVEEDDEETAEEAAETESSSNEEANSEA